MVDRALADWSADPPGEAAALALDSSLFHLSPAPPHLPCATIRCGGRSSCSHTSHHSLCMRCLFADLPVGELELPSAETRPGRMAPSRAPSRAPSVRKWVKTWWYATASPFTDQRMCVYTYGQQITTKQHFLVAWGIDMQHEVEISTEDWGSSVYSLG
jgi:hypothetical protein